MRKSVKLYNGAVLGSLAAPRPWAWRCPVLHSPPHSTQQMRAALRSMRLGLSAWRSRAVIHTCAASGRAE